MTESRREIVELWQRADEALQATDPLLEAGFADFAVSRAYYAAFYRPRPCCRQMGKYSEVIAGC